MARRLLWGLVVMTALILWGCGGGYTPIPEPPKIELPIVEFPQHKLDFSIVTDKKVYQVEILKAVWRQDSDELNDPNELVGGGSYGIAAGLRLTRLDGKEPPPFNAGYGPIGKLDPLNPDLPIDGYGSLPYYIRRIRITHPVIEALMERGIFLSGVAYDVLDRDRPVPILAGIINTSEVSRTVTIKPISNYPTV